MFQRKQQKEKTLSLAEKNYMKRMIHQIVILILILVKNKDFIDFQNDEKNLKQQFENQQKSLYYKQRDAKVKYIRNM